MVMRFASLALPPNVQVVFQIHVQWSDVHAKIIPQIVTHMLKNNVRFVCQLLSKDFYYSLYASAAIQGRLGELTLVLIKVIIGL